MAYLKEQLHILQGEQPNSGKLSPAAFSPGTKRDARANDQGLGGNCHSRASFPESAGGKP